MPRPHRLRPCAEPVAELPGRDLPIGRVRAEEQKQQDEKDEAETRRTAHRAVIAARSGPDQHEGDPDGIKKKSSS